MSRILWVDLETTGTDEHDDALVEIAALVTDERLDILDRFEVVINTGEHEWDIDPYVLKMHTDNGLKEESLSVDATSYVWAMQRFADWVEDSFKGQRQIPLAGSGVAHFDRRWLMAHLANYAITERFTYWSYDVGSARRFAKLVGADLAPFGYEPTNAGAAKKHRAMDDILDHLFGYEPTNAGAAKKHRAMADIEDHLQEAHAVCNMFRFAHDNVEEMNG